MYIVFFHSLRAVVLCNVKMHDCMKTITMGKRNSHYTSEGKSGYFYICYDITLDLHNYKYILSSLSFLSLSSNFCTGRQAVTCQQIVREFAIC